MKAPTPTPIAHDSRVSFALDWYASEEEALLVGRAVETSPRRINGGWHHGEPGGRVPEFDFTNEDGVRHYAVRVP